MTPIVRVAAAHDGSRLTVLVEDARRVTCWHMPRQAALELARDILRELGVLQGMRKAGT